MTYYEVWRQINRANNKAIRFIDTIVQKISRRHIFLCLNVEYGICKSKRVAEDFVKINSDGFFIVESIANKKRYEEVFKNNGREITKFIKDDGEAFIIRRKDLKYIVEANQNV